MSENYLFRHVGAVTATPDATFAVSPDGERVTYGGLLARSGQFANVLVAMGVEPGDRVAVQAKKSIDALLFYLAVVRCGGVYLPLNTGYTPAEIDYFLRDAEPRVFVCDEATIEALRPVATAAGVAAVITMEPEGANTILETADDAVAEFVDVPRGADDLAALLYTSGTTGRSKGAMLTHDNLVSNAEALRETWRFTPEDVLIHALPIFHTHGLFVATNVTLMTGSSMIVLPKFDADAIIDAIPSATCLMGVPTFYTRLVASGRLSRELCERFRLFISGSAPLLADTHDAFRAATGHAILERYGMTEANMITSNPYDGERRAGTVGFALPGVSVRIADQETGQPVAKGDIGVAEVTGPNIFTGYWRMAEKTRAEFRDDGYFITGDLARFDEDGYLVIVGRGKDLIISGGLNVYPKEVESAIDDLPGVQESAVIGVPHPDFGEGVVAVVVPRTGADLAPAGITAALADRLARFKQPKSVVVVDELPRNTMGKVQKNILRDAYAHLLEGG